MSNAEKNWQTTRPTIRERNMFMFNNDLFSDVKFVVPKSNGESGSKQVIPAHKFVLSISSPVFEAMFYGELAETRDSVELPDCEYESLLELFRYMYSDEVNLSGGNVLGVLYLAKKYMVPSLADKCTKYLQENLHPTNAFSILPSAQKYEENDLIERCWRVIDEKAEEAVTSEGFATIDRSLLEAVVERDTLSIKEITLFQAVDLWATKECERQGLTADGEVKRRILGEAIVKGIRFPVMKEAEFARIVIDSEILTSKEIATFFKYYNSALNSSVEFIESERTGFRDHTIHRCGRFQSVTVDLQWNYLGKADFIDFSVDRDIMLNGLCLLGSENNDYSVTLEIREGSEYLPQVFTTGTFSSKLLKHQSGNYYGFEVLFDSPAHIKKNTRYQIKGMISGAPSWNGIGGMRTVVCGPGVTITFQDNPNIGNGTNTSRGQFPEVLFSLLA